MWQKKESKLELAASMVRQVMPEFREKKNVIILCDSWYVKKDLARIVDEYENLDLTGNARSDSVIYDLSPAPAGRKGRPAKHGRCLSIYEDFFSTIFPTQLQVFCAWQERRFGFTKRGFLVKNKFLCSLEIYLFYMIGMKNIYKMELLV